MESVRTRLVCKCYIPGHEGTKYMVRHRLPRLDLHLYITETMKEETATLWNTPVSFVKPFEEAND